MGSKGSSGQSSEQKRTELLNQKSLLLQQKQGAAQDKRLAQEQYQTEVSEWEAGQMSIARRAAGAARRGGGSVFEKTETEERPEEGDYSEYDDIMADLDKQLDDLKKKQEVANKPKPPTSSGNAPHTGKSGFSDYGRGQKK